MLRLYPLGDSNSPYSMGFCDLMFFLPQLYVRLAVCFVSIKRSTLFCCGPSLINLFGLLTSPPGRAPSRDMDSFAPSLTVLPEPRLPLATEIALSVAICWNFSDIWKVLEWFSVLPIPLCRDDKGKLVLTHALFHLGVFLLVPCPPRAFPFFRPKLQSASFFSIPFPHWMAPPLCFFLFFLAPSSLF